MVHGSHTPPPSQVDPSGIYDKALLDALIHYFGNEHAAWLVLSTAHYNWRAHADMAALLTAACPDDCDYGDDALHLRQHLGLAVLEQLYEQVDLFCRLVAAYRSHRDGGGFLRGYCSNLTKAAIDRMLAASVGDWIALLPHSDFGPPSGWRSFDQTYINSLARECLRVSHEIQDGYAKPAVLVEGAAVPAMSLRDGNAVYRHGTRVLYSECIPAAAVASTFIVGGRSADPRAVLLLDYRRKGDDERIFTSRLFVDRASLVQMTETIDNIGRIIVALVVLARSATSSAGGPEAQ